MIYFYRSSMLLTKYEYGWLALSSKDLAIFSSSLACYSSAYLFLSNSNVS